MAGDVPEMMGEDPRYEKEAPPSEPTMEELVWRLGRARLREEVRRLELEMAEAALAASPLSVSVREKRERVKLAEAHRLGLDAMVRAAALESGEAKPHPAVQVIQKTTYQFDEEDAICYAMKHRRPDLVQVIQNEKSANLMLAEGRNDLLRIDRRAFTAKIAKPGNAPGIVKVEKTPAVRIAQDLSAWTSPIVGSVEETGEERGSDD